MNLTFHNRTISGLLTVVPANERSFLEDMRNFNFPAARSLKLKAVMGYDRHRLVTGATCCSDLAVHGLQSLFDRGLLRPDEFDALIFVSQTPDYLLPPTSNVIQGRLGLKQDLFCLDINQGCAGFLIGLIQGFMMLDQESIRKVVLINAEVLSRKISGQDRNNFSWVGDAASIAILERSADPAPIHANLQMDGTRHEALIIPAGGLRRPCSPETALLADDGDNNLRAPDHFFMDGTAVFNFVQTDVPPLIEQLLQTAEMSREAIDYFLFHQPNRFMLQKLADKLNVPHDKVPMNVVERFGNSSSVTIPMAVTHNLREQVTSGSIQACLAGFGTGLTCSAMLLRLGGLRFCEMIEFQEEMD